MIDTDKYEGHTGPWLLIDGDIYKGGPKETHKSPNMIADTAVGGYGSNKARHADRLLMADAPLLLEEVKRLHVEVRALRKAQGYDMKFPVEVLVIDEYMSENRQLRKQKEMYLECIHASQFKDKPGSAMSRLNQMLFLQRSDEK